METHKFPSRLITSNTITLKATDSIDIMKIKLQEGISLLINSVSPKSNCLKPYNVKTKIQDQESIDLLINSVSSLLANSSRMAHSF